MIATSIAHLMITLGGECCYYPHYTEEETEAQKGLI